MQCCDQREVDRVSKAPEGRLKLDQSRVSTLFGVMPTRKQLHVPGTSNEEA
jgi:hypothetical protein